jgi:2-iminobutanoate/2-iminopropanoate deaminase
VERTIIATPTAPGAIGPYSQAVVAGSMIYTSGQLGIEAASGNFVAGGVAEQTRQALTNVQAILAAAGSGMDRVVKVLCFLSDIDHFAAMNAVYAEFFPTDPPARSCVEVARLPKDGLVEIEAIALLP